LQRETTITRWADRIIESGWLLALVLTPYFFSLLTARHFEPDKAMALRTIVLTALAAWAIKAVEQTLVLREPPSWRSWLKLPLTVPALLYAGVFVIATLASERIGVSWWGSYQRGQGTYTNLSYIALFALIIGNLRTRAQLERLLTTVTLTGVAVSLYGIVQHLGLDPLPWKGNVITRISSTMGNSIFVAAYLIMVTPWALYRIVTAYASYRSAPEGDRATDWTWLGFFGLLFVGQQALLLGVLKFMAGVRPANGDFRYWWVFPAVLIVFTGVCALVSAATTVQPNRRLTAVVLAGLGVWTVLLLLIFAGSTASQIVDSSNGRVSDWWLWLLIGVVGIAGFLIASFFLPRRSELITRTFALGQLIANSGALMLILLAIFFSQSRGPWIGGMVGLGLFTLLLLLRLIWTGREQSWPSLGRLRAALWTTLGLGALLGALLITFNLSHAPIFEDLRQVQYIGRLGRLLETDDGTGRVRTLIWFGDDQGGGAVGLLRSNLLRTLTFGHGPETMFTAYNPFYPPELARYEARGASPDRAHQAWLDELITKGALGLLSYFFLFGSAAWLALRQLRRSTELSFQVLAIAALATIAAHFFEVLVGIPIVSTLTMLWVSFGILVVGGLLEGLYSRADATAQTEAAPSAARSAQEAPAFPAGGQLIAAAATTGNRGRDAGRGRNNRSVRAGAASRAPGRPAATTVVVSHNNALRWVYPLLLLVALWLGWTWNLRNSYADMFLNQAQSFTPRDLNEEAFAFQKLLRAVEVDPTEDYYYLQLGNGLLRLIYPYKLTTQQTFDASTAPRADQRLDDLFEPRTDETQRVVRLIRDNSTEQMLDYARLVLEHAFALNPYNKDHPANLGRLYSLWARQAHGGPAYFDRAAESFETARRIAPNDAAILNELATTLAYQGKTDEAEARFKESIALDPRYAETYARLGELYRQSGRVAEAAAQYAEAVSRNRVVLEDSSRALSVIVSSLQSDPQALATLRAAFETQKQLYDQQRQQAIAEGRAPVDNARFLSQLGRMRAAAGDQAGLRAAYDELLQVAPDNVAYRQQYSLALSDTLQYDAALEQAQAALSMAQQQKLDRQIADLQQLIAVVRSKAGG
jgi:tetratricopeptide (TPR) repeat protein